MARGITENDVFTACDALLLAGERPTIERVRQKIGRGSPNTVSPMLDAWFKGLGRRLQDPGAFAAPPDIAEPVLQAAQHFWEVAQAGARADLEVQVAERLRPMHSELELARHAAETALARREVETQRVDALSRQLQALGERLDVERLAHAATTAEVAAAKAHVADLQGRLAAAQVQLQAAQQRAHRDVEAAHERATGAERRAALEIENERTARARADRRAETVERRLEALQGAGAAQLEELVAARTSLEHERREVGRLVSAHASELQRRQLAESQLAEVRLALCRAETEAKRTREAMTQMLPLIAHAKAKKAPPKVREPGKA